MKKIDLKAIQDYFLNHPLVEKTVQWTKEHSLPGFFKVPIHDVTVFLYYESQRTDLFTRANAIAFSFFLSIFPSLIGFFTLIPLFKIALIDYLPEGENFDFYLRTEIQRIIPGVAGERLFAFIDDITNNPRFGLLSFGFILAIYFASNGVLALMQGFEKSYPKTFKTRGEIRKRLIALALTGLLGVLLMGAVILIILGEFILGLLYSLVQWGFFTGFMIQLLRWVAIFLMFYFGIAIIFRYGAPVIRRIPIFSPGTTLSTVFCILTSVLFSAYVNEFNTYNELYGSIGAIIALMLWIQLNSLVLLIGFELNASIAINRDLKAEIREKEL